MAPCCAIRCGGETDEAKAACERGVVYPDVDRLAAFYATPLGRRVAAILKRRLRRRLGSLAGRGVVFVGFGAPLLAGLCQRTAWCAQLVPERIGVIAAAHESALVMETALPLPDDAVDVVILLHALEAVSDPDALMREIWRVLRPEGRLVAILPRRASLWARVAHTPFGYGRPWRQREIEMLLTERCFIVTGSERLLRFPPFASVSLPALAIERMADAIHLPFGGLLLVTAVKRLAQPLPVMHARRPAFVPAHAWRRAVTNAANGSIQAACGSRKESWPCGVSAWMRVTTAPASRKAVSSSSISAFG